MDQQSRHQERARIAAILLAVSILISLAFLAFAFIQKNEADNQRQIALEQREYAERNYREAEIQRQVAEEVRMQLEKARLDLQACVGK
jgi:hypothetical protein